MNRENGKKRRLVIRWPLVAFDVLILVFVHIFLLGIYGSRSLAGIVQEFFLSSVCILATRYAVGIYKLIWRYGGIQCYIKLIIADAIGGMIYYIVERSIPMSHIAFDRLLAICAIDLLLALSMRMIYRYAFKFGNNHTFRGKFLRSLLFVFTGAAVECVSEDAEEEKKENAVNIAIVGAGSVGVSLAEELINTYSSVYVPSCFIDVNKEKIGRKVLNIPVLPEEDSVFDKLRDLNVREVVFTIPHLSDDRWKDLYERYLKAGFKIKKYDYPMMQSASAKRQLREFDIEELLFRKSVKINNEKTWAYYKDKVVLITGGGGSIGSELCRQIAKCSPKRIVILDIYENGAYDVQQELRLAYGDKLDLRIEIASITSKTAMRRVFEAYHPDILINAAAHKHVPLMEHNCIEAVMNNVFGTKNLVELCEEFETSRFMMVSTDKAVNPTNVMGATKRMCELIVQSASTRGKTVYSATRFGNVLGSAGSVIPLFKRQIANGGPVTITDKRIIRYFMTIPEAAQLVMESGAMAKNGELFVLDMGQPVKIMDLAQSMIRLSGAHNVEIKEIGLRPGEKLYEELLVKTEELDKTENKLIFIERDAPLKWEEVAEKLEVLKQACDSEDDDAVREALHLVIPTYKRPKELNKKKNVGLEMSPDDFRITDKTSAYIDV